MGWKKEPNVADLTPTAVIVALERDLLLSSLSRPVGSVRGIPSPAAVPKKAPADARAAAEVIALIRRGEFVAALTCPAAKEALIVPAALEGQPAPSPDVDGVSALYASVEAAVESAGAAAAQAGALPKAAHELVILAIGVAALNAFIQANVTGPDCRDAPHCPLTPSASAADLESSAPAWNKWAVKSLTEDGEDLVGRCFLPQYLYLARALLGKRCATRTKEAVGGDDVDVAVATLAETRARAARKQSTSSSGGRVVMWPDENVQPPSLTWWASRAAIAHQRLLSGRSPTLRGQLLGYHALTLCWYVYLGTHILIIARTIRSTEQFVFYSQVRAEQRGARVSIRRRRGPRVGCEGGIGRVTHALRRRRRRRRSPRVHVLTGDGADGARVRPRGQRQGASESRG